MVVFMRPRLYVLDFQQRFVDIWILANSRHVYVTVLLQALLLALDRELPLCISIVERPLYLNDASVAWLESEM